jgi:KUP system potassium uptake protein
VRLPEAEFLAEIRRTPPVRLPGTAAFLVSSAHGIPLSLTNFLKHNHALHERVLLVTAKAEERPRVADHERAEIIEVAPGITRVILRFGFMEGASIPHGIRCAVESGRLRDVSTDEISYYIGRETVIPTRAVPGMAVWREALFAFMQRNAERSAAYFRVPARQVFEVGTELEI